MSIYTLTYVLFFSPLVGSVLSGIIGINKGPRFAHFVTVFFMLVCLISSTLVFTHFLTHDVVTVVPLYTPFQESYLTLDLGLYLDRLSVSMVLMVSLVSFLVHIFSLEYMKEDRHQPRFFSYISLFTFMMIMLVLADNLLMLFAGWEGVGLVSYLLIGFWMTKSSAVFANLKAFLINRVGDLGFIIAIAATFYLTGTFNYIEIFEWFSSSKDWMQIFPMPWLEINFVEVICFFYFIGAMGKSAQMPLHLWLPDSMEGPTPISALIHAATMVTAGIFMVARFYGLFALAPMTTDFILSVGSTTALAMGLVGLVQNDIKRIIAYSTLSQLGYMVLALGLGAYNVAIFHLLTHAFFKALLFLGAGAVIIAMHHNQNIMSMGGLWRSHKGLFALMLIGSLSLMGVAPLAGFYSKDLIIIAAEHSASYWAQYASFCATAGVYVTSLYSLRLLYYVFIKSPKNKLHFEPVGYHAIWPLWILAFFACVAGYYGYDFIFVQGFFDTTLSGPSLQVLDLWLHHHSSPIDFAMHGFVTLPFYLIIFSLVTLALIYGPMASLWSRAKSTVLKPFLYILETKYGYDAFLERAIIPFSKNCGVFLSKVVDSYFIDNLCVDSQARITKSLGRVFRSLHSGVVQNYVLMMSLGLVILWVLVN